MWLQGTLVLRKLLFSLVLVFGPLGKVECCLSIAGSGIRKAGPNFDSTISSLGTLLNLSKLQFFHYITWS